MKPNISMLAAMCALALASSGAYAHNERPMRPGDGHHPMANCAGGWPYGTFVSVDTNGDGYLDSTEVVPTSPWYPYYGSMDANHDGRVTAAEADAYTMAASMIICPRIVPSFANPSSILWLLGGEALFYL